MMHFAVIGTDMGAGVVCYLRNNLSYDVKSFFSPETENIFF